MYFSKNIYSKFRRGTTMINKKFCHMILLLFIFTISISANTSKSNDFTQTLNEHNMIFTMPKDFKQISIKDNENVSYQHAIKSKKVKLEIRYSIFSLKEKLKEYKEWENSNKKNSILTDPNQHYSIFSQVVIENIAGSENSKLTLFDKKNVKDEFNADWGGTTLVEPKSDFGKGYKYALITALHKDNIADVYIFFLFDDLKTVQKEITQTFYNLRFMSDYFNKRSVLFSAAFIISNINKEQTSPLEIGKKVNFKEEDKLTIDDYLTKIAKITSLKMKKIDLAKIQDVVNLLNDGYPIVIIYVNNKISHSAVIKGYKVENGQLIFRVYDSGLEVEDFINASSFVSSHWKLKPERAYSFTK